MNEIMGKCMVEKKRWNNDGRKACRQRRRSFVRKRAFLIESTTGTTGNVEEVLLCAD